MHISSYVNINLDKITPLIESSIQYLYDTHVVSFMDKYIISYIEEDHNVSVFDFAQTQGLDAVIEDDYDLTPLFRLIEEKFEDGNKRVRSLKSFFEAKEVSFSKGLGEVNGLLYALLNAFNDGFVIDSIKTHHGGDAESGGVFALVTLETPNSSFSATITEVDNLFGDIDVNLLSNRPTKAGLVLGEFVESTFLKGIKDETQRELVLDGLCSYFEVEGEDNNE